MIPDSVRTEILRRIHAAEAEHRVQVVLAVESGSRAWGFESPNSDFDARFIYVHRRDWYLSIDDRRDVIEYPIVDDIDLNGWELRKSLRLFRVSNPAFVEWIQSPIVYLEHGPFAAACRDLLPALYSWQRGINHYRSMAKTNYRGYLRQDLVPLKKYFYVLRPLLSVRWLEAYRRPAPIEFGKLLHLLDGRPELIQDIQTLLARKREAPEMGLAPQVASIHAFIESELQRLEASDHAPAEPARDATERLNELFLRCLSG
jgi:uncharacterized protein